MVQFETIQALISLAEEENRAIYDLVIAHEMENSQKSVAQVTEEMRKNWCVMREAIAHGIVNEDKSASGLVGGDAKRLWTYAAAAKGCAGASGLKAVAYAIGVSEVNAIMGRIVACPTAGSCGILPGALFAVAEKKNSSEEEILQALFTAAGVGMIIAKNASIAGAEGGCQAECGSAAAMAAAALVQLSGGSPSQIGNAVALAMKNMLGLVCDPVAGLVEIPCVKRNGFAAMHAVVAADMALSGIETVIPVDEVVQAMHQIGLILPKSLKETSEGGLADTPSARRIERQLYDD